eukprot:509214_1
MSNPLNNNNNLVGIEAVMITDGMAITHSISQHHAISHYLVFTRMLVQIGLTGKLMVFHHCVSQSSLSAVRSCSSSWPLTDFKLYEHDPTIYVISARNTLQFFYDIGFYFSCNAQETIGFYVTCSAVQFYPTSLKEDYYINITNTSLLKNTYEDYTISIRSTHPSQKIYSYFRLLDQACYRPQISVSISVGTLKGFTDVRIGV